MTRTKAQRRAARRKADRRALYNPAAPLSGSALRNSADSLVALEFKPQKTELARQAGEVQRQGTALTGRAGDYYMQLAGQEQTRLEQQKAIAAMLDERLGKIGQDTQGAIAGSGERAAQLQAADTATRGPGLDGGAGARVAEELAAAQANAAARTQSARDTGAAQSANYQGLQVGSAGATAAAGGETQQRLLNAMAKAANDVRGEQVKLAGLEGAARSKALQDLRQQSFENIVTSEGLGIKRADLEASMRDAEADRALAERRIDVTERNNRRNNRTSRRGQNMTAGQRAADRKARRQVARQKAREKAGQETTDVKKMRTGIVNAQRDIGSMLSSGLTAQQKAALTEAGATDLARNGRLDINTARKVIIALGGPPIVAAAAAELAKYGGVRASTAAQLRKIGMKVPDAWLGAFSGPRSP